MVAELGKPRRVLVVEDEADVRELLVEYFRTRGYTVADAADGRSAISVLERDAFDLVLTDLQLPEADGLAVLAAARRLHPSIDVVIVTGFASLDSAIQAVRLGAYDYLTKPFSLGQIDVVLRRIDKFAELQAENQRLSRQLAQQEGTDLRHAFLLRLEGIENRLTRIEAALRPR